LNISIFKYLRDSVVL